MCGGGGIKQKRPKNSLCLKFHQSIFLARNPKANVLMVLTEQFLNKIILIYYSRHKSRVHGGVRYYCELCEYSTTCMSNLKRHKESKHEGIYSSTLFRYLRSLCRLFCIFLTHYDTLFISVSII